MKYFLCILFLFMLVGVVVAEPPKCILVVKPIDGDAPLAVMASEESGDATIVDWAWDFGDGNRAFKESKVEHVYDKSGEYRLSVTVINDKGEETSQEQLVVVKEPVTPEPTPIPEETQIPVRVVYQGSTDIRDSIASKSTTTSASAILSTATSASLKDVKYPYNISTSKVEDSKTVVTKFEITKFRCDTKTEICGYWITATRDGQEVQTNSPIWISPQPYEALVSDIFYTGLDETTRTTDRNLAAIEVITLKEDPKEAVEQVLQRYVDNQLLGKATVGTKE